jgi:hypothetical protein
MRTTLSIDDDVLAAARERARRTGRPLGAVISDLARRSLTAPAQVEPLPTAEEGSGPFRPFPPRGKVVSNELIDALRDVEGV